jgi:hypothetical protein
MATKREFFDYMSEIYDEKYKNEESYRLFKSITAMNDKNKLNELHDITLMTKQQRLQYRYALAINGKELTPHQVDQYITTIDYALRNRKIS